MKLLLQLSLVLTVSGLLFYGFRGVSRESEGIAVASATPAERGRALAAERGCEACHSLNGTAGIGPSWMGSYGVRKTFADGTSAVADEEYLRRSMLQPQAQVVAGFDNLMLPAPLTDAQVADIIALIRELTPGNKQ